MTDLIEEQGAIVEVLTSVVANGETHRILVNGTDVGLVEDWHVEYERGGLRRFTLTLITRKVVIA